MRMWSFTACPNQPAALLGRNGPLVVAGCRGSGVQRLLVFAEAALLRVQTVEDGAGLLSYRPEHVPALP